MKNFAKNNPHSMGAWSSDSKTHVSTMTSNDFRSNEKSVTLSEATDVKIEFIEKNGKCTVLKESTPLLKGEIIDALQKSNHDGIILNAGGYTHTSVAIKDCIKAIKTSVVEVHISNITAREEFRHTSLISPVVEGCIFGFGLKSYDLAIKFFESKN